MESAHTKKSSPKYKTGVSNVLSSSYDMLVGSLVSTGYSAKQVIPVSEKSTSILVF